MKTALVTGAGCDIGREVALHLGSRGFKILTHERSIEESLKNTHDCLKKKKIPFSTYYSDLSDIDEVEAMCQAILDHEDEIGAVIQVAGGSTAFGHEKITPSQIVNSITTNLVSPMVITHKLLPKMTDGSIVVFTAALSGIHAGWYPTDACFDAAKGGLLRFTENMARNLGPKTRVNAIVIGLSYVEDNYKGWREGRTPQIPMGRVASPKDYVKCVNFFLENDYVTGVSLRLDGGWFAYNVNPPFASAVMQTTGKK